MNTTKTNLAWKVMLRYTAMAAVFFAFSCGSGNDQAQGENFDDLLDDGTEEATSKISDEILTEIIQRIPSPVEIVALIKSSGAEYSEAMLNPTENTEKYTTSYQQAFNLGVYGADLGYINVYEKTISSLSYLNAVKAMADLIKVGQFFDFNTLKRLSSNKENIDSLLYITTSNFNRMDDYLREQGRADLSILTVAGAWLEGLHITCNVAKLSNNKELIERIGEQKIAMHDIALLLDQYNSDENMAKIAADFNRIKIAYDAVIIETTQAEPEMKEVEGKLVIVDNSTSKVTISDEMLENIIEVVTDVRNKCIN
jgi:hypothetical protein